MRGERACGVLGAGRRGITPAYAGRTASLTIGHADGEDHPRVCGENVVAWASVVCGAGSPPRMRGELEPIDDRLDDTGITPAYAGRTLPDYACYWRSRPIRGRSESATPPSSLGSVAPSGAHATGRTIRGSGATHQFEALQINNFPIVPMYFEVKALLVPRRVHQNCSSVLAEVLNPRPNGFTHPRRDFAHKNSRADLQQPPRHEPAQTGRAGSEHQHHHGCSLHDRPPGTTPSLSSQSSTMSHSWSESSSVSPSTR